MGERLRTSAAGHPGRAVGLLAAIAVLGTALAAGWTDRLTLYGSTGGAPALKIRIRGGLPAQSGAFRVTVATMRKQISADPAVRSVRKREAAARGTTTALLVRLRVAGRKREAAIDRIERNLDPGPLTLRFGGPAAAVRLARDQVLDDLLLLLAALPVIALVATATLGFRGAAAALLAAAAAAALAALVCELLAGPFDVSWLALLGAIAAATLMTMQLCALTSAGAQPAALAGVGAAGAIAYAATGALGVDYLTGLALGGGLGAAFAVPAASVAGAATVASDPRAGRARLMGVWRGVGSLVAWSRLLALVIALFALLLILIAAAPAARLVTAAIGIPTAPRIGTLELLAATAGVAIATIALATAIGRRLRLAALAGAACAAPALATAGLLVVTFQDGGLAGQLGYASNGAIQLGSLVGAVATVAAVGAAQAVSLAWAAREVESRPPAPQRVAEALASCAPAIALTCLAGIAAGVALGFSSARFEKELGLGIAAGLALQLLAVQGLIAPALLRLTDRGFDQ